MSEDLTRETADRIRAGIVRIRHPGGLGTGFFVAPQTIATCRHVIGAARADELEVSSAAGKVSVVRIMLPSASSQLDAALLVVDAADTPVLPVGPARHFGTVYSAGFQFSDRGYDGYPSSGRLAGIARDAASGLDLLQIDDAVISGGLSGAPLYGLADERVVGIVKRDRPEGGGYAVPIEQLEQLEEGVLARNTAACGKGQATPIAAYFRQLSAEHEHFVIGESHRRLALEELYTSLTLVEEAASSKLTVRPDGALMRKAEPPPLRTARRDRGRRSTGLSAVSVSVLDLLSFPKSLVTGEPGSGKTTLLRHVARRVCKGELARDRLPILVRLSSVSPTLGCFEDFVRTSYPVAARQILDALAQGSGLLLLDGLDEAPRRHLALLLGEVDRLAAAGNQVIMTCRSVAVPRALLSSDFKLLECIGFSAMQQRRFLRQWFGARLERAISLEQQIARNRGVVGFARNPFLLSLMAMVAESDEAFRLPTNRPDLYERALRVLLERRSESGKSGLSVRRKFTLLRGIAHHYFIQGRENFSEDSLLEQIEQRVAAEAWNADPELVLDDLINLDGILAPHRKGTYRFLHLTFQEYLTAMELAASRDAVGTLAGSAAEPRWEEVLRLTCGMLPPAAAEALIDALIVEWETSASADHLLLATRAATDARQLPDGVAAALASSVIDAIGNAGAPGREPEAEQVLGDLCRAHEGLTESTVYGAHADGRLEALSLLRILAYSADPAACSILTSLWDRVEHAAETGDDDLLPLAGAIVEAAGRAGLLERASSLIGLLSCPRSYLATAACLALIELQTVDRIGELEGLATGEAEAPARLALSVLLSFQIPELTERLFVRLFPAGCPTLQDDFVHTFNRGEVELSTEVIQAALENAQPDVTARLMSLERCFVRASLQARALAAARADTTPGPVAAAATATLVRVDSTLLPQLIALGLERAAAGRTEVMEAILTSATNAGAEAVGQILVGAAAGPADVPGLLHPLLAFVGGNRVRSLQGWVVTVLEDADTPDALWWRAFCALAALGAEGVLAYGRAELQHRRRANPMAETVVYRALGELQGADARAFLMGRLVIEKDPATVAEVLSALGRHQDPEVHDLLVRLADPANWPASWPPPEPPLRQGDQRPSDRRSFAIIAGLEQFADARSAAVLSRLADDTEQPYHLREIAGSAARNIELAGGLESSA